jgi:hypothetical protein
VEVEGAVPVNAAAEQQQMLPQQLSRQQQQQSSPRRCCGCRPAACTRSCLACLLCATIPALIVVPATAGVDPADGQVAGLLITVLLGLLVLAGCVFLCRSVCACWQDGFEGAPNVAAQHERVMAMTEVEVDRELAFDPSAVFGALAAGPGGNGQQQQMVTTSSAGAARQPLESGYYELLDVDAEASAVQIKRAYYRLALQTHPDKHPGDPSAAARFQAIGQAYQVLSDEGLRARYDRSGVAGVEGAEFMDAAQLWVMLFGSEKFEALVGQLPIQAEMLQGEGGAPPSTATQVLRQKRREAQVALDLARTLAPAACAVGCEGGQQQQQQQPPLPPPSADHRITALVEAQRDTARELAASPFGASLLHVVGRVYCSMASRHLGYAEGWLGLRGHLRAFRERRRAVGQTLAGLREAGKVVGDVRSAIAAAEAREEEEEGGGGDDDDHRAEHMAMTMPSAEAVPQVLRVVFAFTTIDIENTLRRACDLVLRDEGVEKATRLRRAHALYALGELYMSSADATAGSSRGREENHQAAFEEMAYQMQAAMEQTQRAAAAADTAAVDTAADTVGASTGSSNTADADDRTGPHP